MRTPTWSSGRIGAASAAAAALLVGVAACGGDDDPLGLSSEGAEGRRIANANGCAACHGSDGSGNVGPAFQGLYDSTVELEDGTTVTADEAYLTRSITDPGAQVVAGAMVAMPENQLSDEDVAKIVAYIRELQDVGAATT